MKRVLSYVLCLCFILIATEQRLWSYGLELGLKAAIIHSKADISRDLPYISIAGIDEFSFGSFISIFLIGDRLGIQPEILYSVKGFDVLETDRTLEISSKYKISYIEIPILVAYKFPLKRKIETGLVFGPTFGIAQKVNEVQSVGNETETRELGDNLKKTDIGLVIGGNFRYYLGSICIIFDTRYTLGLVNISKNIKDVSYDFRINDSIKNRAFTFSLGIAFNPLKNKNQ